MRDEHFETQVSPDELLRLSVDIVCNYVGNNSISSEQLPDVIRSVFRTVSGLSRGEVARPPEKPKPAIAINRSITDDYIVCLEDGKKLKMLKRHLRTTYNMSPDEYRKRWGLPADYPMVAPNYAARRSEFAKRIGLGRGVRRKEA